MKKEYFGKKFLILKDPINLKFRNTRQRIVWWKEKWKKQKKIKQKTKQKKQLEEKIKKLEDDFKKKDSHNLFKSVRELEGKPKKSLMVVVKNQKKD